MSRPRSQYVELEPTYRKFLLRTRRMGYTSTILALLGGFPNPGTFNMQLYDAFAPSDLSLARWRRLADALEFTGTIIVDAEPVPYVPDMMETA
jgi:hypothetical protein